MTKKWNLRQIAFSLLLISLMLLPGKVFADTLKQPTCSNIDEYVVKGWLVLAEEEYKKLLETDPLNTCASEGLQKIAEKRCEIAQQQADAGDIVGAKDIYTTILNEYGLQCASDGLAKLTQQVTTSCEEAQQYLTGDKIDVDVAEQMYKAINVAYPQEACALDGLRKIIQARCNTAQTHLDNDEIGVADQIYKAITVAYPQSHCALIGLQEVAVERCKVAEVMAETSDVAGARTTYTTLLETYPDLQCASEGLAALPTPYDEVKSLVQIGDYDEALTKLKGAIATSPNDPDLEILDKKFWVLWPQIKYWFLIILTIIVVIWIIVILAKWFKHRLALKVDVLGFDPGGVKWEYDASNGPQPGNLLVAEFEQEMVRLCVSESGKSDVIETAIEHQSLPSSLQAVSKEVGYFWDIITKLIPDRIIEIKGTLKKDTQKGVGLYVKLIDKHTNKLWGSYTVWQNELALDCKGDDPLASISVYVKLTELAVIVAYRIIYKHTHPKNNHRNQNNLFDTKDAYSFYYTNYATTQLQYLEKRSADESENVSPGENDIKHKAITLLRKALKYDPSNNVARFKLGELLGALGDGRAYLDTVLLESVITDPIHIATNYCLGTEMINQRAKQLLANNNADINKYAQDAVGKLKEALNGAKGKSKEIIAQIKIPYADALKLDGNPQHKVEANELIKNVISKNLSSPRVFYNLACHYSMELLIPSNENPADENAKKALSYLEKAFQLEPDRAEAADKDLTLRKLKEYRKTEFYELLNKYKYPSPLIRLVGSEDAKRLQTANVISIDDLLREASNYTKRNDLCGKHQIDKKNLLGWVKLAELVLIRGIGINQLMLLNQAKITSLDDLKKVDHVNIDTLHGRLNDASQKLKVPTDAVPDIPTLEGWIRRAKQITTAVEVSSIHSALSALLD